MLADGNNAVDNLAMLLVVVGTFGVLLCILGLLWNGLVRVATLVRNAIQRD